MRRLLALASLLAFGSFLPVALTAPMHATADPNPAVVAVPISSSLGFATPLVVTPAGGGVTFANLDTVVHNVVSVGNGPDGRPLFRSADLGSRQTGDVAGVPSLAPGQYAFVCIYHGAMHGTLVVLDH